MTRKITGYLTLAVLVGTLLNACQSDLQEAKSVYLDENSLAYEYGVNVGNKIPALGRVLFYDPNLSLNNTISCASCHKQAIAFSDNARFSRGFENRLTGRNSMPIQNLQGFSFSAPDSSLSFPDPGFGIFIPVQPLFWDGRETDLNQMVMRPIVNHVEMGITDLNKLANKLNDVPYYGNLFNEAYGSPEATPDRIADALAWFVKSITSNNTRLDKSQVRFEQISDFEFIEIPGVPLTAFEELGKQLFVDKYECNACHQVQDPHGYLQPEAGVFANIGLDPVYTDNGVAKTTNSTQDNGKFKIPSLRNVALTAPYMHDGRFNSLDEVMDHYSEGIANHPNLDDRLQDDHGNALRLNITTHEKQAIIAFLNTLTDFDMIKDPKYSNPFKIKQ